MSDAEIKLTHADWIKLTARIEALEIFVVTLAQAASNQSALQTRWAVNKEVIITAGVNSQLDDEQYAQIVKQMNYLEDFAWELTWGLARLAPRRFLTD